MFATPSRKRNRSALSDCSSHGESPLLKLLHIDFDASNDSLEVPETPKCLRHRPPSAPKLVSLVSSTPSGEDQPAGAASPVSPITRSYSEVLNATPLRLSGFGLDVSGGLKKGNATSDAGPEVISSTAPEVRPSPPVNNPELGWTQVRRASPSQAQKAAGSATSSQAWVMVTLTVISMSTVTKLIATEVASAFVSHLGGAFCKPGERKGRSLSFKIDKKQTGQRQTIHIRKLRL